MNRTRWIVAVTAGLAVVLGGSAALAPTGSSNPASDFLGDVSKRLGISQDKLEGAIEDATIARVDAAVAAGDISKEEGEALKERVRSGDGPVILPGLRGSGIGPLGPPKMGFLFPGAVPGIDLIGTAADYLGMDDADVRDAVRAGKSLADLARDKGKSVDGLKDALRDAIREDANRAVEKLSAIVDELVEQTGGPHPGFGLRGPGLGPPDKDFFPGVFPGIDLMGTAGDYLGMDDADVRKALGDGKSLADLAKDKGKSVEGLEDALRDELRKDADQAVDDGALTKAQADRIVGKLGSAVDKLVQGNLRDGFDLEMRGGGGEGEFGLHLRIHPNDRMPLPERREGSSLDLPGLPSQPI
jgi:lambda repressor-like predicted transcriptional regulator